MNHSWIVGPTGDEGRYIEDQGPARKAAMEAQQAMEEAKARVEAAQLAERVEAQKRADIARQVELSLANNAQYQAALAGRVGGGLRVEVRDGVATMTQTNPGTGGLVSAPAAIVDNLPKLALWGGMEVSHDQAKAMVDTGELDEADYWQAVEAAVRPMGMTVLGAKSFR